MQNAKLFVVASEIISYQDDIFSLDVKRGKSKTLIYMRLFSSVINTRSIPTVYSVLKKVLPSVLASTCFNEDNLPFSIEVKATEIGHLFEHILLEYLCQARLTQGAESAIYSGSTRWNWHTDPRGTFHIHITSGVKDSAIFEDALIKTIQLTKFLLVGTLHSDTRTYINSAPISLKNGTSTKNLPF